MKHALLRTLPGRAIVLGAAVKIAVVVAGLVTAVPAFLRVVDTVASVALATGGGYFLLRGVAFARRRLLWRVRRKLIISYIFIGFIPSLLIVAFFLLGGLFLFSNFSSYLVQNRFGSLSDRAALIASATASEIHSAGGRGVNGILSRRRVALANEFPTISFAVVPTEPMCRQASAAGSPGVGGRTGVPDGAAALGWRTQATVAAGQTAGPWTHVEPPSMLPGWLRCEGFAGLFTYGTARAAVAAAGTPPIVIDASRNLNLTSGGVGIVVRGVGVPDASGSGYAVVVDIPMDDGLKRKLRGETGVDVTAIQPLSGDVRPLEPRSSASPAVETATASGLPLTSVTFLEQRDWRNGNPGAVMVSMRLSIGEIYARISTQAFGGQRFSQGLLVGLIIIGGLFLIIQAVALVAGLTLARSITGSVHELFAGTERVRQGDFTHKIDIKARDQLGELAESFNSMTASIEDLLRDAAEKKRLEEELRIAHEIQMSLLPQGPLSMPGMSVTALCVPAREVGGDYYDVLPLDDHRVGVLIADVSGKGTYAALYMAELKGLVLSLSRIYWSPRELLITANQIIAEHLDARTFITMTYAVVDLRARTLTYARAGHTPLIYLPGPAAATRGLRILAPDGLVLGLKIDNGEMFERLLQEETIPITPGDLYLFFTDGISEAMNETDDCFGETRLAELVEEHAHLPSDQLRERVLREIAAFVGAAPQHDDMTMILLRIEEMAAADPPIHREPAVAAET
jgi:serine phosphatase RsbU (regulator of sigma subunit)